MTLRRHLWRFLRTRGWNQLHHQRWPTGRIYALAARRWRWWQWGEPLRIIVGQPFGGTYDEPTPPTWFYRLNTPKPMWRTRYPRHPLSAIEVIRDYAQFRERTAGLNEDELDEWKAICADQDGDVVLGRRYWGGSFHGLNRWEQRLLLSYLLRWHVLGDWFGARSWLYSLGLHASVHARRPFTCQVTPPRGAGGYDHWYCERGRRHEGLHRYNNMVWGDGLDRVQHVPTPRTS